jgi:hypothetical protein
MRMAMIGTVLAAALLAATPAASQGIAPPKWNPKAPENNQLLPAFSYATVEPVLSAIGAKFQRGGTPTKPALAVTLPNNRKAVLSFVGCNAGASACKAVSIQATWPKVAGATPDQIARGLEEFNRSHSFAKTYSLADGRVVLQRYLTADYGFIRGDLAVNLLVFASQMDRLVAQSLRPLQPKR